MNTSSQASKRFDKKHVVIVHGYTASPEDNWFPWLAEVLRSEGARVSVPAMPDSHFPDPDRWAAALQETIPVADANTILVGHSLGCVTALRHVLTLPAHIRVGGLLLVSGFDRTVSTLPKLHAFTDAPLDYAGIRRRAANIISMFSDNDSIVEPAASVELSHKLDAEQRIVRNGGHFLDQEGFVEFKEAYEAIVSMVRQTL